MRSALLSFVFLWFVLLCVAGAAELITKRGRIEGESFVNLRSGPDLSYPSKAILRRGEEIAVEREESGWYLVSLADGRKGYVHKTLVALLGDSEKKVAAKSEPPGLPVEEAPVSAVSAQTKSDLQPERPERTMREAPRGKPLPVIRVLEGREGEILWWFAAALCVFVIGWICGGNYYLRRDRTRRRRLHF